MNRALPYLHGGHLNLRFEFTFDSQPGTNKNFLYYNGVFEQYFSHIQQRVFV